MIVRGRKEKVYGLLVSCRAYKRIQFDFKFNIYKSLTIV